MTIFEIEFETEITPTENDPHVFHKKDKRPCDVIVTGEIYAEPFIHYYPSGKTMCIFRIGVSNFNFSYSTETNDFTLIHCAAYNRIGTEIFKRFNLGDHICVGGILKVSVDCYGNNTYDMTITSYKRIEK